MKNESDQTTPLTKEELIRLADAEAHDQQTSLSAGETILTKHFDFIIQLVKQFNVLPRSLVSSELEKTSLPTDIRAEIAKLQTKMRIIITATAERIEDRKNRSWEDAIEENYNALYQKEQASKLISAEKKVRTSTQNLRLAVKHFVELNNWILARLKEAEKNQSAGMAKDAVLANAILVYELCDFVIQFIENFQINGLDELKAIAKEAEQGRQRFRQVQETRKKQATAPGITERQSKLALEHIRLHEEALKKKEQTWKTYWEQVERVSKAPQDYVAKLPDLCLMRDLAGDRLDFITLMDLDNFISTSLQDLDLTAENMIKQLDMPPMTLDLFWLLYGGIGEG